MTATTYWLPLRDESVSTSYPQQRPLEANIAARFRECDTFEGVATDPISLHKYLYAHANPVTNVDPSGKFTIPSKLATIAVLSTVSGIIGGGISAARKRSVAAFFTGFTATYVGTFVQLSLVITPLPGAIAASGFVGGFITGMVQETLDSWAEGKEWNREELWTNVAISTITGGVLGYFGAGGARTLVNKMTPEIASLREVLSGAKLLQGNTVKERLEDLVVTSLKDPGRFMKDMQFIIRETLDTIGISIVEGLRSGGRAAGVGFGAISTAQASVALYHLFRAIPDWIDRMSQQNINRYPSP